MITVTSKNSEGNFGIFEKGKYYISNGEEIVSSPFDQLSLLSNNYFLAGYKLNNSLKYTLLDIDGSYFLNDNLYFDYIKYDESNDMFSFYNNYVANSIKFPKLDNEKKRLFNLILSQIWDLKPKGKDNEIIGNMQMFIDELYLKIDNISIDEYNEYADRIKKLIELNLFLGKPDYLKGILFVLCKDDMNKLYETLLKDDVINDMSFIIFNKAIRKSIINIESEETIDDKVKKLFEINLEYFDSLKVKLKTFINNRDFYNMVSFYKFVEKSIEKDFELNNKDKVFNSVKEIKEYILIKDRFKFIYMDTINKLSDNVLLNLVYNKHNSGLIDILRKYVIG